MSKPQLIAVVGPTASGKTALAIEMAKSIGTEIISFDSRQFYKELPIGCAMPTPEELAQVKHHFIACRSITDAYAAGEYAADAKKIIDKLLTQYGQVVLCGGSGLYLQAVLFQLDHFPEISEEAKQEVENDWKNGGILALQDKLKRLDPTYYQEVDLQNTARLRRALEVCVSSGKAYSTFRTGNKAANYSYKAIGIDLPKNILHERIHTRVDSMIRQGLEEEARSLLPYKTLKSLQTVGYKEFFQYFQNEITRDKCIEDIKTHTRQYAKRQLTWFKNQLDVEWKSEVN